VAAVDDFDVRLDPLPTGGTVLKVTGELDLATAPQVEGLLDDDAPTPRVIDLSKCSFVDSSGLRVLVAAARRSEESGARLAVVTDEPAILRVLEITALAEMVDVHPTLDAAL
jgi:anti-anti-sigma factor